MKPVIIGDAAELESVEAIEFYKLRGPRLGGELKSAIGKAIEAIRHAPDRYPLSAQGTRRFVLQRFPFVIHYKELSDVIWIVALAHTSRRPGYWQRRTAAPPEL